MKLENIKLLPSLFRTIGFVDDVLDNIGDQQTRVLISADLVRSLTEKHPSPIVLDNESLAIQSQFRNIDPRKLKPALGNLFAVTENLHCITNAEKYAQTTAQDGINTAVILLLFLGLEPNNKLFKPFLTLAAIHKLCDSLRDLKSDADNHQISIPPDKNTRQALKSEIKAHLQKPL